MRTDGELRKLIAKMADDPDAFVRLQVAFTAGAMLPNEARTDLCEANPPAGCRHLASVGGLSSAKDAGPSLLESLAADASYRQGTQRIAGPFGRDDRRSRRCRRDRPRIANDGPVDCPRVQSALLEGLGQGARNSARPLSKIWENPPAELKPAVARRYPRSLTAARMAQDEKARPTGRLGGDSAARVGPVLRRPPGRWPVCSTRGIRGNCSRPHCIRLRRSTMRKWPTSFLPAGTVIVRSCGARPSRFYFLGKIAYKTARCNRSEEGPRRASRSCSCRRIAQAQGLGDSQSRNQATGQPDCRGS